MPVDPSRTPLAASSAPHDTALLIIDMISLWDFADAERLSPGAVGIAPRIAALKRRCTRHHVPTIYVNDSQDRWRSEFGEIARLSVISGPAGATIGENLLPNRDDYSVLKPKHSAFFATPLDLLLRHLRATRLILTGVAADLCISMSAAEAHMRDYEVVVPRDCVAALSTARCERALRNLKEGYGIHTPVSTRIRLSSH